MIIKVTPDREKIKSILRLVKEREDFVATIDNEKFPTNSTENYYEIIKGLASALILADGYKATGENAHKDLFDYLSRYSEFSGGDIVFMNDLRIKRNNSSYEGKKVEPSYLRNNKEKILLIIRKLKSAINGKP